MPLTLELTEAELKRFWSTVTKSDGCWICSASPSGIYARMNVGGKKLLAHVISYVVANGSLGDGMIVRHSCDTPRCVNPDHLLCGTQADNIRDMISRKRNNPRRGELNAMSKITDSTALQIRQTVSAGTETASSWAAKLGTSDVSVYNCLRGKTFPHVGGPRIKSTARKIYDSEICEMRWMAAHGHRNKDIAAKFGLHQAVCSNYVRGHKRADLPGAIK